MNVMSIMPVAAHTCDLFLLLYFYTLPTSNEESILILFSKYPYILCITYIPGICS